MPILRPHVQDRTKPGRVADTAAIGMQRVGGEAVFPMFVQVEVGGIQNWHLAGQKLRHHGIGAEVVIGIGHIAVGRQDETELGGCSSLGWSHHEGDVVLGLRRIVSAYAQARGINAALQVLRHVKLEADVPSRVVDVVVMEMDRSVFIGLVIAF